MRAVNLIPADLRGGGSAPTRTGVGVYVLLGALAAAVVLVAGWAVAGRQVDTKRADLARVQTEADAAEQRAGQLAPYARFAELRTKRVDTVRSLARSRFNWPFALREVSRVMPENVWFTQLTGTVAPGIQIEGGSGGGGGLRQNLAVPAIEITGCTTNQANVARFITRLRQIDGVTRVSLSSSEKSETSGGGGGGGGGTGGDCRAGSDQRPQFQLVAFFERSQATAGGAPATGGGQPAGNAAATAAASSSTTQPGGGK